MGTNKRGILSYAATIAPWLLLGGFRQLVKHLNHFIFVNCQIRHASEYLRLRPDDAFHLSPSAGIAIPSCSMRLPYSNISSSSPRQRVNFPLSSISASLRA